MHVHGPLKSECMEGNKDKYSKLIEKAEKYLKKHHGSDGSTITKSIDEAANGGGGGYRAYLKKAKEFMQRKDDKDDALAVDAEGKTMDKKKQCVAIGAGLLAARKAYKKKRKKRRRRSSSKEEEEGEGEENSSEEEEEEEEDEEEGGWFQQFVDGFQELIEGLE